MTYRFSATVNTCGFSVAARISLGNGENGSSKRLERVCLHTFIPFA